MSDRDPIDVLRDTLDGIENLVSTPQLTNENLVRLVKGRMNEGHAALAVLERQREGNEWDDLADTVVAAERRANDLADALRELADLLRRIDQLDHMDTAHDGPYWRSEIRAALDRHTQP